MLMQLFSNDTTKSERTGLYQDESIMFTTKLSGFQDAEKLNCNLKTHDATPYRQAVIKASLSLSPMLVMSLMLLGAACFVKLQRQQPLLRVCSKKDSGCSHAQPASLRLPPPPDLACGSGQGLTSACPLAPQPDFISL